MHLKVYAILSREGNDDASFEVELQNLISRFGGTTLETVVEKIPVKSLESASNSPTLAIPLLVPLIFDLEKINST